MLSSRLEGNLIGADWQTTDFGWGIRWWRTMVQLEWELSYATSGCEAKAAWDTLVAHLLPGQCQAIYTELMECAQLWRLCCNEPRWNGKTLLDALIEVACADGLRLTDQALLAAFRLRQLLSVRRQACG